MNSTDRFAKPALQAAGPQDQSQGLGPRVRRRLACLVPDELRHILRS